MALVPVAFLTPQWVTFLLNRFLFSSEGGVTGPVFVVVVVGLGRWCYSFGSRCCFFVAVFVVVVLPR